MATLPLYQPTGYLPADTPRLDFANLKEQANQLQTITSSLDRVSNFAFKQAMAQAEREGLQYGAENQPSAEQVMAALERGESPQELFAKPGTIFGDAARKIQAGQLRNELEVLGRKKLADLSSIVESGNFNLQQVQQEITSMTAGYAKAISAVSPDEGLKFRASMGLAGNSVYTKAADRAMKIYQLGIEENINDLLSQQSILIPDIIKYETDPQRLEERIAAERQRNFDLAQQGGPEILKDKISDFNRRVLNGIVEYAITPDFASNAFDGLKRIQNNDFGKLSVLMKRIDKDKLLKAYSDRMGEMAVAAKRSADLENSTKIDIKNAVLDQYYMGNISGSVAMQRIKAEGITLPDSERKSLLSGDNDGANAMMYGQLESLADRQVVGESYFDDLATAKVISWKQANTLKKVVRNDNPEMSRGRQLIEFTLGINDPMSPGIGNSKQVAAEAKAELLNRQQQARMSGEAFNPYAVANEIIKTEQVQQQIKSNEQNVQRLTRKFERYKVVYDKNRIYTADDLNRLGIPKSEHQSILNIQKGL